MTATLALDPPPLPTTHALFDLTRLIRRRAESFGTGVDRIDLALGLALTEQLGPRCGFVAAGPLGPAPISHRDGAALLRAVARRWRGERVATPALGMMLARGVVEASAASRRAPDLTYVVASHGGLATRPGGLARLDPMGLMPRLAYVHDLIPIEYPEYQRPRSAAGFARFLAALAEGPVAALVNSADTGRRLEAYAASVTPRRG